MRQMRMRKISLRKHFHNALAHYTVLEMFDVFSRFELAEMSVAPTISNLLAPAKINNLRSVPDTPTTKEINHLLVCDLYIMYNF